MQLNLAGWSALVGAGLLIGSVLAVLSPLPRWAALGSGTAATWLTVLLIDHRRYRNMQTHICHGGLDAETGEAVVAALAPSGVEASYREYTFEDEDEILVQRGILCRNADAPVVHRMIEEMTGNFET